VADSAYSPPGYDPMAFVVRKDLWDSGGFQGYGDLRGKRVATGGGGSVSHLALDTALQRAGLDPSDVETTTLSFADNERRAEQRLRGPRGADRALGRRRPRPRPVPPLYGWPDDVLPPMRSAR